MVIMWLIVLPLLLVLLLLLLPLRLLLLLLLLLLGLTICFFPISTSIQSIQSIFWSILRSSDLRRKSESIIGIICICQESEIVPWTKDQHPKHGYVVTKKKMNPYGYGSIPIDTLDTFLVGWTSIYQLFWGSLGTRVLTHPHIRSIWRTDISDIWICTSDSEIQTTEPLSFSRGWWPGTQIKRDLGGCLKLETQKRIMFFHGNVWKCIEMSCLGHGCYQSVQNIHLVDEDSENNGIDSGGNWWYPKWHIDKFVENFTRLVNCTSQLTPGAKLAVSETYWWQPSKMIC